MPVRYEQVSSECVRRLWSSRRTASWEARTGAGILLAMVLLCGGSSAAEAPPAQAPASPPMYFDPRYTVHLLFTLGMTVLVVGWIAYAKRRTDIFVRRIPGLDAIDEAVGRAVEMGKPVFFSPGILPITEIPTVAAMNILRHVAALAARYSADLKVYNIYPGVLAVSEETVREACLSEGKPEAFRKESVVFLAAEQFSYAAALSGLIVRAKPASALYFGPFYAESLILTETGFTQGVLQIAGTDRYTQLPFFITTCDYVIMGDEFFAASAYLSREPKLLGSIKAQDYAKATLMLALCAGFILESFGCHIIKELFSLR